MNSSTSPESDLNSNSNNSTESTPANGVVVVSVNDLPMHCPKPDTALWDSHPKVFIPVEESGEATCPYCGTLFKMADSA